jgi:hypothetical protein
MLFDGKYKKADVSHHLIALVDGAEWLAEFRHGPEIFANSNTNDQMQKFWCTPLDKKTQAPRIFDPGHYYIGFEFENGNSSSSNTWQFGIFFAAVPQP